MGEFSKQISVDEHSKIFFMVTYSMCMITQISVPCFFGSLVFFHSGKLLRSLYFSDWAKFDHFHRKMMIIATERARNEIEFRAGGIFPLNLISFLKVQMRSKLK